MNVDSIINWVLVPLLRFPLVFFAFISHLYSLNYPKVYVALLIYTVIVNSVIKINEISKLRGPWMPLEDFPDAKCVLTGGAQGLGYDIVQTLLERFPKMEVIVIDIVDPKINNERVHYHYADLSQAKDVDIAVDTISDKYGDVDLLINCAGMRSKYEGFLSTNIHDITKVFQVNVFAPVRFIQRLAPKESKRQFYAVTIGSALGIVAPARISTYASTKSALIAFHDSWSYELTNKGINNIRTLLVLPGQMNTKMFNGFQPPKQFFAPVVESERLAKDIAAYCNIGMRGQLCTPLYVNFMHILAGMPQIIMELVRSFSEMDACLPDER
ncbi:Tda5p Ecym_7025 [Eremothecium cymbalariae DBVPG|uniref:NAD(P)-binding protein n=1 Tax=Eremothecium cymbalariae (strain CBS 270.75 / DBVPG 7215 / KCTC 17166 / NRRL Y-17582) TaxID=931890 RepID=G8JVL7_ERECY|nr:hypothetical protein Ecym_7025 [Eremothecium cymbalariae DBVPG\